jgi:hypothetical protein
MDQIPALTVIPPAKRFHFQPEGEQGGPGLFDLGLHSAMCEREGQRTVKQDLHGVKSKVSHQQRILKTRKPA